MTYVINIFYSPPYRARVTYVINTFVFTLLENEKQRTFWLSVFYVTTTLVSLVNSFFSKFHIPLPGIGIFVETHVRDSVSLAYLDGSIGEGIEARL